LQSAAFRHKGFGPVSTSSAGVIQIADLKAVYA
jgi:hypothetical protein